MEGTVERFFEDRNYGFIDVGTGKNVFFHVSRFKDSTVEFVREGQRVSFEIRDNPKGPEAVDLEFI